MPGVGYMLSARHVMHMSLGGCSVSCLARPGGLPTLPANLPLHSAQLKRLQPHASCPALLPLPSNVQMAAQLAAFPLAVAGMRVQASQLHAPGGVVLVGDAAHGVTPRTGGQMCSAGNEGFLSARGPGAAGTVEQCMLLFMPCG